MDRSSGGSGACFFGRLSLSPDPVAPEKSTYKALVSNSFLLLLVRHLLLLVRHLFLVASLVVPEKVRYGDVKSIPLCRFRYGSSRTEPEVAFTTGSQSQRVPFLSIDPNM